MMKQRKLMTALLFAALLAAAPALRAQEVTKNGEPLEITADQTLEWHRNKMQFIARGQTMAKQGEVTIQAATLSADYRESKKSSFDIYQLTAEGQVVITARGHVVTGDKLVYDVEKGLAVMTGESLTMTAPGQTVTARDSFEYSTVDGQLRAVGRAKATKDTNTIEADELGATFQKDAQGQNELQEMTADGSVVITTPTETLTGDRGVYKAATKMAEITGHVKIKRGPNILEGDRADVNLATSVSRIHGSAGTTGPDGRVRGVFYPGSEKKQDKAGTP